MHHFAIRTGLDCAGNLCYARDLFMFDLLIDGAMCTVAKTQQAKSTSQ